MIQRSGNNAGLAFLLCLAIGCNQPPKRISMPFINKPDYTPEWIDANDSAYTKIHRIPEFSFIDQDGKVVSEKTIAGKIYVASFFFTRCAGICPKLTANMAILQERFREDTDVVFLSHSVTPDADSVPVLRKYARAAGIISDKWHLLTGSRDEIYRLARKEYYAGDTVGYYQAENEFLHTENFILLDQKRRIRGVYNGTLPIEMDRITDDIMLLKQDDK